MRSRGKNNQKRLKMGFLPRPSISSLLNLHLFLVLTKRRYICKQFWVWRFGLQDENFEIRKEMYRGQQYSQIYFARLHLMRTLLYSLVPNWKPHLPGNFASQSSWNLKFFAVTVNSWPFYASWYPRVLLFHFPVQYRTLLIIGSSCFRCSYSWYLRV